MLKEFAKIVKEVKDANKGLAYYLIIEIAKVVYKDTKNEKQFDSGKYKKLMNDFWYYHNQQKSRSNDSKRSDSVEAKIQVAQELMKEFGNTDTFKNEKWFNFIYETACSFLATNKFGKRLGYATKIGGYTY